MQTLAGWLEKGECNKKNANTFYSLIQACNNQVRRLYNEKMGVDEEFLNLKTTMKDKFANIVFQCKLLFKLGLYCYYRVSNMPGNFVTAMTSKENLLENYTTLASTQIVDKLTRSNISKNGDHAK